ncbi:Predicted outer membrane protein [uncultured Ruminococcus sp.]|nr:Predicted outer membrane protein [uncultured Ruminococcus sp.]
MKRENNKKFKKRKRNQNRSLTCRVLSMMFAIVLFCSTVLINTDYVSQASSFDDMVDMVEVEEDSAAVDISEETGDDLGTDVNFESEESTDETYSESDDLGSSDADFSSGENMFTDGTSESSAPAEEAAQPVSCIVKLKNETIEVKAEAPAGVLPNGTQMSVKAVENNTEDAEMTDQYNKLAAKITEQLQSQGKNLDGFLAYNVSFTDADGNPVEPAGKVNYSFTYKEASSPELTDPAASTVTAAMIRTNKETSELELTELKAEEDQLTVETNESRQLTKAAFQSAATAAFTFVWSSTPAADDNENNENKEENGEVNNEEVNADTNTENTEENGEETNTENNVENSEEEQNPEEAPDQEQIKMIRITADEVNLRVSPSTEADVIATVDTDTQLPLIETVTGEDEFTWYEVSYEEAEAYVRSDMAEVVETEEQDVNVEEQTPAEITRYDYESDEVNVKVTLTNPEDLPDEAELSVTPVEISQEAEEQINQEAIEQQKAIENLRAYDIKFLLDGEEIQPGATVKVEVSFPEEETAEDADVYHVDENENVENMNGSVNEEGNVEFDTPHFSTYIIVNKSLSGTVKVTLQHYDADTNKPIYAETDKYINVGGKIPDYRAAENYDIQKVVTVENGEETEVKNKNNIEVVKDTTVRIYYKARSSNEKGDMTLYDYQIKPNNGSKSINDSSYYDKNSSNRMIMGTKEQANLGYDAKVNKKGYNANTYNHGNVTKDLVSGLSRDFKTVEWNVDQPGFFTDDNVGPEKGKQKYTDYKLNFEKKGNQYKLTGVTRPDDTFANAGADFYPLDSRGVSRVWDKDGKDGNYYFGIRYDIEFQLGDYIGPLNYKFTGDDDLWVLLDGKVVIDVGGIHDALTKDTDLWKNLGYENGARPGQNEIEAKNATHRITVLYMERGAGTSNCQMEFTIPDARFVNVTNVPLADITIHKVNSSKAGIPGAKFRLENAQGGETYPLITSDNSGNVTFNNLKVGTYTLTETMAPNGYVSSKETYKVIVTENNGKATAKLYKSDGTTEVKGNTIINYTETEEAEKNLTSSKSAKIVDDKNRIYQIDLNAEVTGKEADQEAKNASVVLVLDASKSMKNPISDSDNTQKITALRSAANKFIETLSKKSEDSQVSIIWYRTEEGYFNSTDKMETLAFQKLDKSGVASLTSFINQNRTIDGGTPMGSALEAAYNQLRNATNGNDKYVLFMTDGMPGYYGDGRPYYDSYSIDCMTANKAVNYANRIKDSNDGKAVLYTVGVGLKDKDTFLWKAGHSDQYYGSSHNKNEHDPIKGSDFLAYNIASGSDHAYNTSNVTDLVKEFELIAGKIGDLYTVQPTSIVDVIDARFELTEDSVNDLAQKEIAENKGTVKKVNESETKITWTDDNGEDVGKVTIVKNSNGTTTITWTGAAAKIGNAAATAEADKGWKASFKVKAKDDFIGGNMIPTNGAASGIYLNGGGVKKFEQPSVNVKLLNLTIDSKNTTVFKGEPISAQNFRNELAETIGVVELDGKTKTVTGVTPLDTTGKVKLPELTDTDIRNLETSKTLVIGENQDYKYTYPGSADAADAVGYFTYTYELVKGNNAGEHTATTVGDEVEKYQLTVTYHPYSISDRKSILSETGIKDPNLESYKAENAPKQELVGTHKGGVEVTSTIAATGTYIVNVVAGELQIIKKLDTPADQNEIFNFVIKDKNNTDVATATATVVKGSSEATAVFTLARGADAVLDSNKKLTELSKGDYTVGEVLGPDARYELLNIEAGATTNCSSVVNKDEQQKAINITFALGTDLGSRIGVAEFTNKKSVVDIDFEKVDIQTPTTKLSGAEFDLYKADADGNKTNEQVGTTYTSDSNGGIAIENLPIGKYVLVERKAPTGYQCSAIPWKITVANDRNITVTYNDESVQPSVDANKTIYQLTNAKVYTLPSTGGNGIYWYMIGGMVLMSTAAWILYKNKCREVLGK